MLFFQKKSTCIFISVSYRILIIFVFGTVKQNHCAPQYIQLCLVFRYLFFNNINFSYTQFWGWRERAIAGLQGGAQRSVVCVCVCVLLFIFYMFISYTHFEGGRERAVIVGLWESVQHTALSCSYVFFT